MIGDLTIKLSADTGGVTAPIQSAKTGLDNISEAANNSRFNLGLVETGLKAINATALRIRVVSDQFGVFGRVLGGLVGIVTTLSAGITVVGGLAFHAAIGLGLILAPLKGIIVAAGLVAGAFKAMFGVILLPLKAVISAMRAAAAAIWALAKPLVVVAKFFFTVKIAMASFHTQLRVLGGVMSLLPPKVRLLVGGLALLGAASRVSALGAKVLAAGWRVTSAALRVGTIAVLAAIKPMAALKLAAISAAQASLFLASVAFRTSKALLSLGISAVVGAVKGLKTLGVTAIAVGAKMASGLLSIVARTAKMLLGLGTLAVGWGIKLAADAEQAEIAFSTMLKSGSAARKVLGDLEQFAASTPFQLNDLRDGAKQLLNAQLPTTELTNKLRMLGDIAAGTSKPIKDFVRIYAKVKSTGKVSLETLNQLAERGVPIYTALQKELGVSREEMLKMISRGKVGFDSLNTALESTATGAGVFAGGMERQSQTVSGLFSTLRDNVSFAMRELGIQVMNAFNFKSMLSQGIAFFQGLRSGITAAQPVFIALANTVKAGFAAIWEVASVVFSSITSAMGIAGGNIMETILTTLGVVKFVFQSWPDLAQFAFTKMGLFALQGFGVIQHFFTGVLPALFNWFTSNWKDVFFTAADWVATVFINIAENIKSVMSAIWDFIASGGTAKLKMAWKPLTDGFVSTIKTIPEIPDRAIGDLERQLAKDSERLGKTLGRDFGKEIADSLALLPTGTTGGETSDAITAAKPDGTVDENQSAAGSKEQKSAGILERGSAEAFKAIIAGQRRNAELSELKKQTKAQQATKKAVEQLAANPVAFAVQGAV